MTVITENPDPDNSAGVQSATENGSCIKSIDVVAFGSLCVDIVLHLPKLPPSSSEEKAEFMRQIEASNPDESYWEAGGNCNFAITAARLGLHCVACGYLGDENYGHFLLEVLEKEGVHTVGINEDGDCVMTNGSDHETILCWVLVDHGQNHDFWSRFGSLEEPGFSWINKLSAKAEVAIKQSKALFLSGYLFLELSPGVIVSVIECARSSGTAIFFDPGPECLPFLHGTAEQQETLKRCLSMSDVLLLTTDEQAESFTGIVNPVLAAHALLNGGPFTKWVVIKMGSRGSLMVTRKGLYYAPSFKVDVADTVGCGDSFAAAIVLGYINSVPLITTLALANTVGGATAMGCGAGRNVATMEKILEILLNPKLSDGYEDYWKELLGQEHLFRSEIVPHSKEIIKGQDDSFCPVAVQNATRDALELLQKCSCKTC